MSGKMRFGKPLEEVFVFQANPHVSSVDLSSQHDIDGAMAGLWQIRSIMFSSRFALENVSAHPVVLIEWTEPARPGTRPSRPQRFRIEHPSSKILERAGNIHVLRPGRPRTGNALVEGSE